MSRLSILARRILLLCPAAAGAVETGRAEPVVDLLTGKRLGAGPVLELSLHRGQTRVLQIAPDE